MPITQTVEQWLAAVVYKDDILYVPTAFTVKFVNFIKLVNGEEGEEHKTPVVHLKMLDNITGKKHDTVNMCHRGISKTTLLGEYLILYMAVFGEVEGFGTVDLGLYVSDSIDNGVKNMRKNLEFRWDNSDFLKDYVPNTRFTDIRWEFKNKDGKILIIKGYGAKTGVRGTKELGKRPTIAILDDLISDEDARSKTIISAIEDTVYKAIDYAMHPSKRKIIWSGTPFNANDPLYKAVESGAWYVNVYPVCEHFPCTKEEFATTCSWGDRFTYEYVIRQYEKAKKAGKLDAFYQELMLKITSEDDRIIHDGDLVEFNLKNVLNNQGAFNYYITTDFATSKEDSSDFSVISVWAYNNKGDWLLVDGICKRQLMDANIDNLFRLAQQWKPLDVGIEVSGQQGGFIPWILNEMIERNVYFVLASENNKKQAGIRPATNKFERFNTVVPWFKTQKMWIPTEDSIINNSDFKALITELKEELKFLVTSGFKSKHDDVCDTISQLQFMNAWKPSEETVNNRGVWDDGLTKVPKAALISYIV